MMMIRRHSSHKKHSILPTLILILGILLQSIPYNSCFSCISSSLSKYRQQQQQQQHQQNRITFSYKLNARNQRRQQYDDDDDDDDYYYDDNDDDVPRQRRRRQGRQGGGIGNNSIDNLGGGNDYNDKQNNILDLPSPFGRRSGWRLPESVSKSLLAGVFVLGVGLGVTIDSQVNTNPKDLASRDAIDQAAPNAELCAKYGASAMAFDQRVFVSFNPFNVYVSQADVKPACVLREANVVSTLRSRGLINDNEVRSCKMNMNTWAYVGDLNGLPQLSCVYKSQDAQNEFLSNPTLGIGEDYLDDDREKGIINTSTSSSTGKIVKGTLTEAQKQNLLRQ